MTSQKRLLTSSLGALLGAGMLVAAPAANAFFSYLVEFEFVYPNSTSETNAQCALCHTVYSASDDMRTFNPYGDDFRQVSGTIEQRYRAIEGLNSDGDPNGFTNLSEINCNAQPGWTVGDTPPAGVTGLLDCEIVLDDPDIDVVPTTLDLGIVSIGDFSTGEVAILNVGGQTLTVDSLTLAGDPVFSFGINSPTPPFDIAPGAQENVGIRFEPTAVGTYSGSLTIGSNDPDEPEVVVTLSGSAIDEPCAPVIDPSLVNFGNVELGATAEATITFTNVGSGFCDVSALIRPLNLTQFALCSTDTFTVLSGETENVCVSFTPTEEILYEGLVEFSYTGPDGVVSTSNVRLSGSGSPFLGSYDIYSYRATPRVRLDSLRPVTHRVSIRNVGTTDGVGLLTVVGVQNGVEVFRQFLEVSDPVGGGVTTYNLQSYFPTDLGTIEWTATLESADGVDAVTATTLVQ